MTGTLASSIGYGLLFVLISVAVALLTFAAMRLVAVHLIEDKTQDLAGSVTFRVASLHALILALVFAQETQVNRDIRHDMVAEATAVTDIFYDLDRYGGGHEEARTLVARYTRAVVEDDWPSLQKDRRVSGAGYVHWEAVYQYLLDLEAETARETALRDHMLDGVHAIADYRQARSAAAANGISALFWLAAVTGVIFVTVPYFVFPARPLNVVLLALFAAYTGLIMYIIYALSDPFGPPVALSPQPFLALLEGEIGQWLDGPPGG